MTLLRSGFRGQKIVILAFLLEVAGFAAADAPTIDPVDDSKHFGAPEEILFWTPEQQVAGYRNISKILPTREIKASNSVYPLPVKLAGLDELQFEYDGAQMTIDDYLANQSVAGLLVIKNGEVAARKVGLMNVREMIALYKTARIGSTKKY